MASFDDSWGRFVAGKRPRALCDDDFEPWQERQLFGITKSGRGWTIQVAWVDVGDDPHDWPLCMSTTEDAKAYLGTSWEKCIKK